jgi:DNA-binding response OmpR family regulator
MASLTASRGLADELPSGDPIRILLVNNDPRDLVRYRAILQKQGCQVRTSSSFAEGGQCLAREPFDLVILDQGGDRFEGQEVLVQAMEVDVELRVLVLARSYDRGCSLQAMQSGALDYLEGPLGAAEIIALLETFIPRRGGVCRTSVTRVKDARSGKEASAKRNPIVSVGGEECAI